MPKNHLSMNHSQVFWAKQKENSNTEAIWMLPICPWYSAHYLNVHLGLEQCKTQQEVQHRAPSYKQHTLGWGGCSSLAILIWCIGLPEERPLPSVTLQPHYSYHCLSHANHWQNIMGLLYIFISVPSIWQRLIINPDWLHWSKSVPRKPGIKVSHRYRERSCDQLSYTHTHFSYDHENNVKIHPQTNGSTIDVIIWTKNRTERTNIETKHTKAGGKIKQE